MKYTHMKSEKGVTLLVLIITIVILIIMASAITVNLGSYTEEKNFSRFENDITVLNEAISKYYVDNKKLPIRNKYINLDDIQESKNVNDNENYYVIDLDKLSEIELNFGKDYTIIKNMSASAEIASYNDVYIINEQSQTIYYVQGIEYAGEVIYNLLEKSILIESKNMVETYIESKEYFQKQTTVVDNLGNTITIPAGFRIASDSGLNVIEGIVIEDDDIISGIGQGKGNQFVWVPIGNVNKKDGTVVNIELGRYTFDETTGKETLVQSSDNYKEKILIKYANNSSYVYEDVNSIIGIAKSGSEGKNTTALNLTNFINMTKKYGGFYIARYEATYGNDEKPNFKPSDYSGNIGTTCPEGRVYYGLTQIKAAQICRNIYESEEIKTDLVNSYVWDTTLVFIQKCSEKEGADNYSVSTSGLKTSHTGSGIDEFCKINDLYTCTREWTTETTIGHDGNIRVTSRQVSKVSERQGMKPDEAYSSYGFRAILYLQ